MKTKIIASATAALLALAGCDGLTSNQRKVVAITGGAAAGLIAADALNANKNWRIVAALAGAAAGTVVAQNHNSGACAYARGNGTFYQAPCP
ncbi:glucose-6-phosphate isomerase [Phaeobacter sp. PT47_59]|uniref:glycine zipper 2TM domain-containing protein n=1 Tax=Phaeobacter sp. PT47_59 TaxID=3029979 RepID=UPI002380BDFD|nr:glycine zipper 2TM domain-containing protein [Phaeobacter sp. PT47_59]MDE4175126.1 glucose-6-phosphate isomerase [Phaeobacter sp. PT47_59]